jgi:D-lactate dehydrogenase
MNAFTEYRRPVDILAHLMIGSEGTLGFITEAEIATFPVFTDKLTAMLIFENIESACSALLDIRKAGAVAIEIMDDICIDSAKDRPGVPAEFGSIPPGSAAILCEFEFENANEIEKATIEFDELTRGFDLIFPPYIASEEFERQALWEMRKGLLPSLGKKRPPGSVFIIEDICVPVCSIYTAIAGLRELFEKYSYSNAGIYGHGMDGNLHFMIAADFSLGSEVERFGRFIRQLADLVTDELNGSLKAEHGTGRTMAPYVERQWGSDIYEIMKRIKKLIDPLNILNPGVLINSDERVHLRNLKD